MKGFIRILEALIASFIVLASLTYFLSAPVRYTPWGEVFLRIQAQDALVSLYKTNLLTRYVQENDIDALNGILTTLLPETADFSVEVVGIPNPIIYIGCDCSDAEINDLKNMSSPLDFVYKKRNISIRIKKESKDDMDPRTNIHFMFGYRDLKNYKKEMNEFLLNGGTIFMLSSLERNQVEDGILNETFGLKWRETANPSNWGKFYNYDDVGKVSHRIANYFLGIVNESLDLDNKKFRFLKEEEKNDIKIDEKTIIVDVNNLISHVKVNELTHGRTVWFAEYDHNDNDVNELLKAVILWASGEGYRMNPGYKDVMIKKLKDENVPYIEATYLIPDGYEVRLKSWSIFY